MSAEQLKEGAAATTEAQEGGLLDQVLAATKQTERARAEDLIRTLTEEDLKGTVTCSKNVSAAAFAPFISAAAPTLFGFESWGELSKPRDLEKIFDTIEYTKWKSFRDSEDARFVTLVMPRVLSRLPYGSTTKPIEEFDFE